ncbi:MAG TPA: flippase [Acidimicrobiales bacterium]|nr:flippase [Acidimicrobiales bacterium]
MSGRRRGVASNAAWLMIADIVGKASNFVLVVIVARELGPRQYGDFAFAFAFLPLFLHLARWGIDLTSLRRLSTGEDFSRVFVNAAALRIGFALAATGVAFALVPLFVGDATAVLVVLVVGAALWLDEMAIFLSVAFTAVEQLHLQAAVLIVNRVLSAILAGVVVAAGGGLVTVSVAYLAGSLAAVLLSTWFLVRRLPPVRVRDVRREDLRELAREGAPLGVASLLNMAVFRLDAVLLRILEGPVAVGVYGVAYRFFEPLLFVTWSLSHAATPRLTREATGEEGRTFELSLAANLAFYLPVAVGALFTAEWLLEHLFGRRYVAADDAVMWLAASSVPYAIAHLARIAAIAAGERRVIPAVAGAVLVVNVAANLVLIPSHGVTGAAIATFAAEVLECVLLLGIYARRVARIRLTGSLLAPVGATACMTLVLLSGLRGASALVVGPLVFGVALFGLARLLAPADIRLLARSLRAPEAT